MQHCISDIPACREYWKQALHLKFFIFFSSSLSICWSFISCISHLGLVTTFLQYIFLPSWWIILKCQHGEVCYNTHSLSEEEMRCVLAGSNSDSHYSVQTGDACATTLLNKKKKASKHTYIVINHKVMKKYVPMSHVN